MNRDTDLHDHVFGLDKPTASERRTLVVVVVTAVTMVVEIAAGKVFGSMALLADGLHMGSHAVALGIAAFAYRFARKHATDPSFSFGTGKINALAGYSGAVLLSVFALGMAAESIERFVSPQEIAIDQALFVAVIGLLVNGASVLVLGSKGAHGHHHHKDHRAGHESEHAHSHHHLDDHNFRSAYLHVLADALTSVLAILALLSAKYFELTWLDPAMGIVGAVLVARWSIGLLKESGGMLLDKQAPAEVVERIRKIIEQAPDTSVVDLHIWRIGPGKHAAIIAIRTSHPKPAAVYRALLPLDLQLEHVTVEVGAANEMPSSDKLR